MEKQTIVILGEKCSGKTTLANKLAESKKSITIHANDLFNPIKASKDTQIIIVEETTCITHLNALKNLIITGIIQINEKYKAPYFIEPTFIVISNLKPSAFKKFKNTQILKCNLYL